MPDAAFVFADRLIAFDHLEQCTYVLCVAEPGERARRPSAGSRETSLRLASLSPAATPEWDGGRRRRRARPSSTSAARTSSTWTTSPTLQAAT